MKKLILILLLYSLSVFSQAQTYSFDADKRVTIVNGWEYLDPFLQFFNGVDVTNTWSKTNSIDSLQEFSVAGGAQYFAGIWTGQGAWAKNVKDIKMPDYVTLEAKSLKISDLTSKNLIRLQLQSSTWAVAPGTNEENPLDGSRIVYTWDFRNSKDKLSPGIIRIYLMFKSVIKDSSHIINVVGVRNLTFIYADGSKKIVDFDFTSTGVEEEPLMPTKFVLSQNYPNPFNPSTTISYSVPRNEYVTLKVYDLLGQEVATLVDEFKNTGTYEAKFNASGLSSGMYIYKLQAGKFSETKKMILTK